MISEADLNTIAPSILCADTWPREKLDSLRMATYKELEKAGLIRIQRVRYCRSSHLVAIEYLSTVPIRWARDQMRATYLNLLRNAEEKGRLRRPVPEQLSMKF